MSRVISCTLVGFEDVKVTLPDRWLIRHSETFWAEFRRHTRLKDLIGQGKDQAKDNEPGVSHNFALLCGCVAVCEKIEGLPDTPPSEWPLEIFTWFVNTIYTNDFDKATNPPDLKNLSAPAPTTPKES